MIPPFGWRCRPVDRVSMLVSRPGLLFPRPPLYRRCKPVHHHVRYEYTPPTTMRRGGFHRHFIVKTQPPYVVHHRPIRLAGKPARFETIRYPITPGVLHIFAPSRLCVKCYRQSTRYAPGRFAGVCPDCLDGTQSGSDEFSHRP